MTNLSCPECECMFFGAQVVHFDHTGTPHAFVNATLATCLKCDHKYMILVDRNRATGKLEAERVSREEGLRRVGLAASAQLLARTGA